MKTQKIVTKNKSQKTRKMDVLASFYAVTMSLMTEFLSGAVLLSFDFRPEGAASASLPKVLFCDRRSPGYCSIPGKLTLLSQDKAKNCDGVYGASFCVFGLFRFLAVCKIARRGERCVCGAWFWIVVALPRPPPSRPAPCSSFCFSFSHSRRWDKWSTGRHQSRQKTQNSENSQNCLFPKFEDVAAVKSALAAGSAGGHGSSSLLPPT